MGTWGSENFESDEALDLVGEVRDLLEAELEAIVADPARSRPDEPHSARAMAAVELLTTLSEHAPLVPPASERVRAWRAAFVPAWERGIEEMATAPGFPERRREAIESSFDRLEQLAQRLEARAPRA